jgi:mRNA-degrading endonuclease RelE of RelBE toxin-antitoxin system
MDKISKVLKKLSSKERKKLKIILNKIKQGKFNSFQVKKLKGHANIFRIRKGKMRIIFLKKDNDFFLLAVERRSDNTYNL